MSTLFERQQLLLFTYLVVNLITSEESRDNFVPGHEDQQQAPGIKRWLKCRSVEARHMHNITLSPPPATKARPIPRIDQQNDIVTHVISVRR
jgi:hypothetical protein